MLPSGEEVSVLYFRAGYTPNDYPDDSDWDTRLMLERSLAIKCPSIGYHLTGTKKVQQVLARDGEVERFLPDAAEAAAVRATFAGLWPLDQVCMLSAATTTTSRVSHALCVCARGIAAER